MCVGDTITLADRSQTLGESVLFHTLHSERHPCASGCAHRGAAWPTNTLCIKSPAIARQGADFAVHSALLAHSALRRPPTRVSAVTSRCRVAYWQERLSNRVFSTPVAWPVVTMETVGQTNPVRRDGMVWALSAHYIMLIRPQQALPLVGIY